MTSELNDIIATFKLTENFFAVVDNILDVHEAVLQESQHTANTSAR